MSWQELRELYQTDPSAQSYQKALVESKNGEQYEIEIYAGSVNYRDLDAAADALEDGTEVWVDVSFSGQPHLKDVKIGEWD